MIADLALVIDAQATGTRVDEFDPFDLETHFPFDKCGVAFDGDGAGNQINIVTAFDQPFLGLDVSLDARALLGWILKMNVVVVELAPLRLARSGMP